MSRSRQPLPRGFFPLWTTVALDLIGFGIVIPILAAHASDFGADGFDVGLLIATSSLAQFVASPFWGGLSDRIGRRPVLIVSLVGSAIGSLLTGLAGGIALLFVARLIDGASGGTVAVAQAAATAAIGYSSIMAGARSAGISAPVSGPCRNVMSATASPAASRLLCMSISAPISRRVSNRPARSGFMPIFSTVSSEPSTTRAAAES